MDQLTKKPLFNPQGDTSLNARRMIGGNTTNLNDFNNMRYAWVKDWYRQAMNNFWIPEEISLGQDKKDYPKLAPAERAWCFWIPSRQPTFPILENTLLQMRLTFV